MPIENTLVERSKLNNFENSNLFEFNSLLKKFTNTNKIILYHKKSLLFQGDVLDENYFDS